MDKEIEDFIEEIAAETKIKKETLTEIFKRATAITEILETEILPKHINPEYVSLMKIIYFLGDGKEHSWKEIEENVKLSTKTISKTLKKLISGGFVKRKVVSSFPPKTMYVLEKEDKDVFELVESFKQLHNYSQRAFFLSLLFREHGAEIKALEAFKDHVLKMLYRDIIFSIKMMAIAHKEVYVMLPPLGHVPTIPANVVFGPLPTLFLNFSFWVAALTFLLNKELKQTILEIPDEPPQEIYEEIKEILLKAK